MLAPWCGEALLRPAPGADRVSAAFSRREVRMPRVIGAMPRCIVALSRVNGRLSRLRNSASRTLAFWQRGKNFLSRRVAPDPLYKY